MIIIVFGLPGTGKTFFATHLAKEIGADYTNSDQVRKSMFPKPAYTAEEKDKVYKQLLDDMYKHASVAKPLVIDGTFYRQDIRDNFITLARDLSIDLKWVEVTADEELIKERVAKERPFSDADFEVYKKIKQQYVPFQDPHFSVQSKDIESMLNEAIRSLGLKQHKK